VTKLRQAILKRFKFTKSGKILRRLTGQDHFRTKKPSKKIRKIRKLIPLSKSEIKIIKKYLHYTKRR